MNQEQLTMETLIEVESTVFDKYKEPQYSFRTFYANNDEMNGGSINDTPAGALLLGKEIWPKCLEKVMPRSVYGLVISHNGIFLHKDVALLDNETETLICLSRNPETANKELRIKLDEVDEIFEVVRRSF